MTDSLVYEYGAAGSGLYFTITVVNDGGVFKATVSMLEGKMDLNALWFSDGDGTANEIGSTTLAKSDSSLNMNGSSFDVDGNGTQDSLAWDGYQKISSAGLGPAGEAKLSFLTAGESQDFNLSAISSFDQIGLIGVRATSVTGGGYAGGSIKWVDDGEAPPPPQDDHFCFSGLTRGAWGTPDNGAGQWDDSYQTTDSFETIFGINITWSEPGKPPVPTYLDVTLLDALNLDGGGTNQLAAQATAALLNASDGSTGHQELLENYRFSESEIINAVKWAFGLDADIDGNGTVDSNSGADNVYDATFGGALKNVLDYWNNANHADADGDGVEDGMICFDLPHGQDPASLYQAVLANIADTTAYL